MLGQLRNKIGKRAVASSCDAAADEELVAAAKKGDELGFESLAKRHQRRIFALALRYTRIREDAEDIVQETFQNAFVHLRKFEGKSSFSTWLTRIAINEALMSLRRRRALHEVPADDSSSHEEATPALKLADAGPDPETTKGWPIAVKQDPFEGEKTMKSPNTSTNVESTPKIILRSHVPEESGKNEPPLAQIRERAFEIHIERGGIHGCDLDDWLQAERELQEEYNNSNDGRAKKK